MEHSVQYYIHDTRGLSVQSPLPLPLLRTYATVTHRDEPLFPILIGSGICHCSYFSRDRRAGIDRLPGGNLDDI
jgi:hypothetical protein